MSQPVPVEPTAVVVSNISPQLDETHLRELFECCGTIKSIHMGVLEPRICIVRFEDAAHAKAAALLSGTPLGDRELKVSLKYTDDDEDLAHYDPAELYEQGSAGAKRRQEEIARTVYVGNIGPDVGDDALRNFFAKSGTVALVKLAGDSAGKGARFAFVEFTTLDGAQLALGLNGQTLLNSVVKVGKANNPIFKPGAASLYLNPEDKKVDDIMQKVLDAASSITAKVQEKEDRHKKKKAALKISQR